MSDEKEQKIEISEKKPEISHRSERLDRLRSQVSSQQKLSWFERIEFLNLSNEDKGELAKEIVTEDGQGDKLYWMEIFLSSAIATFGLLQGSVAIIIGAMLIAPLLQPMKAMAFAIATGRSRFFWKASIFLIKSVLLSVAVAAFLLYLSPVQAENSEILARTTPNILDLFVAIFSAMVAFLSLAYKKLSDSVAGVAMAASLMPPLAVCGIELTLGNFSLAWGGFFLFFVNFLAILIVGVVIFMMYGFTPHEELKKKTTSRKIMMLVAVILITTYPLYSSLSYISQKIRVHEQAKNFLEEQLVTHIQEGELAGLEVISISKEEIKFFGSVRIPENVEVYQESYTGLVEDLKELFHKDVDLQLEMIRTANFATKDSPIDRKSVLHTVIRKTFAEDFSELSLIQIDSQKIKEKVEEQEKFVWIARITLSLPSGEYLEESQQNEFSEKISRNFGIEKDELRVIWVAVAQAPDQKKIADTIPTPEEKFQEKLNLEWEHFFATPFFKNIETQNMSYSWVLKDENKPVSLSNIEEIVVKGTLVYPDTQRKKGIVNHLRLFSKKLAYPKLSLQLRFIEYTNESIEIEQEISEENPEISPQ